MKKVFVITGGRGSGKSTAIATLPPPSEIEKLCIFDCEDSLSDLLHMGFTHISLYDKLRIGGDMLERLAKGEVPWVDEKGRNALIGYYEYFVEMLDKVLLPGKYKYFGIDTVEPIEAAMTAAVESGRRAFGWSGTRAFGKMEVEGVRPLYAGLLEAIAQRGVEYITLTSHIKQPWVTVGKDSYPVLDKVKPGGRLKILSHLSSVFFWLVDGDDPNGAPAALVLKARMGNIKAVGNKWKARQILPERIPAFTWDAIDYYRKHPADLVNPAPGERMSDSEREMIGELLSDAQMRLMVSNAEQRTAEARGKGMLVKVPEKSVEVVLGGGVAELVATGKTNKEIVEETGLALPVVIKARKGLEDG